MPNDGFYNAHSVEYTVPKLENGYYAIIASTSPNFSDNKNDFAFSTLWSTSISYAARNRGNKFELTALDKKTGHPIDGVKAVATTRYYDYKKRKDVIKKIGTFYTDKEGYISIPSSGRNRNINIDFTNCSKTKIITMS